MGYLSNHGFLLSCRLTDDSQLVKGRVNDREKIGKREGTAAGDMLNAVEADKP
jgi:hypothetical protein